VTSGGNGLLTSVRDVLDLPVVVRGRPRIVAGQQGLDASVRWVHVSELADVGNLLQGGELVLTTGIALQDESSHLIEFVRTLVHGGAAGLIVELGRKYTDRLPPAMVDTAEMLGLPLIVLDRPTAFVSITRAVLERIISGQMEALSVAHETRQVFNELLLETASFHEIVRRLSTMFGCPIVLEDLTHQVLAYEIGDEEAPDTLALWADRSRRAVTEQRIEYLDDLGWLITRVSTHGQDWGRLIIICGQLPTSRQYELMKQAAVTLAISRMTESHSVSDSSSASRGFVNGLLGRPDASTSDIQNAARAFGFPVSGRHIPAMVIKLRQPDDESQSSLSLEEVTQSALRAGSRAHVPLLVRRIDDIYVGMLLSLSKSTSWEGTVHSLLAEFPPTVKAGCFIAIGGVGGDLDTWRHSIMEARRLVDAVQPQESSSPYLTIAGVGLPELLTLLQGDERVHEFAENELGILLAADRPGGDLVCALRTYLELGRSKTDTAKALHLSRPALDRRLRRVEHLLSRNLSSNSDCLSLHVALLAHPNITVSPSVRRQGSGA